jgi:hypothetical protein
MNTYQFTPEATADLFEIWCHIPQSPERRLRLRWVAGVGYCPGPPYRTAPKLV